MRMKMAKSEMEAIGYEQGLEDGIAYVEKMIMKAIDNPALDIINSKQALGILVASIRESRQD